MSRQAAGARKRGVGEIEARSIALETFERYQVNMGPEVNKIVDDFAREHAKENKGAVEEAARSLARDTAVSQIRAETAEAIATRGRPRRVETSPPGEMVEEQARIARLLKGEERGPYRLEEQVVEAKAPETELARAPERRTMDGVLAENDFNYREYRAERAALQGQLEGNSLERKVELLGQIAELDRGALEAMEGVRDEFRGNKQFQNREAGLKRNLGLIERRISSGERTLEARKEAAEKRAEAAARRIAGSAGGTAGSVREAPAEVAAAPGSLAAQMGGAERPLIIGTQKLKPPARGETRRIITPREEVEAERNKEAERRHGPGTTYRNLTRTEQLEINTSIINAIERNNNSLKANIKRKPEDEKRISQIIKRNEDMLEVLKKI